MDKIVRYSDVDQDNGQKLPYSVTQKYLIFKPWSEKQTILSTIQITSQITNNSMNGLLSTIWILSSMLFRSPLHLLYIYPWNLSSRRFTQNKVLNIWIFKYSPKPCRTAGYPPRKPAWEILGYWIHSIQAECPILKAKHFWIFQTLLFGSQQSIQVSCLHWLFLGFFYALFVQWSILSTILKNLSFKHSKWYFIITHTFFRRILHKHSIVRKRTIWERNNSMETSELTLQFLA